VPARLARPTPLLELYTRSARANPSSKADPKEVRDRANDRHHHRPFYLSVTPRNMAPDAVASRC
jgi:hypothetical protein